MGFLDNIFKNDEKKKKAGSGSSNNNNSNNNPIANIRKNIEKIGQPRFNGAGQSLGGSKPGVVIDISLHEPGPLGIRVEKKSNNDGSAIVSQVVPGSQAERSGLQRGDVLCFSGSGGQNEIPYKMFLDIAQSEQRPIHLDARRFDESKGTRKDQGGSADAEARRRAMIAAVDAREKKYKSQTKTIKHVTKSTLLKQQQQQDVNNFTEEQLQPQTEASRQAMEAAKQGEAILAAELGYNPYEVIKKTAGQARTATTATQHGAIQAPASSGSSNTATLPAVAPPANPTSEAIDSDDERTAGYSVEFEEALAEVVAFGDKEAARNGLKIARTLVKNATTKGQQADETKAEKFRKVRLANAKIKAAIVDVPGNLQLLMAVGFQLTEDSETNESVLVFPPFCSGPVWLPQALRSMEKREKAL